jgi:tripartite ATP-independent transporter DctM subunit
LVGGVISGFATPTEAAALACIYALILGMGVFKTIKLKDIPPIISETLKLSSVSLFALATANALGQLLSYYHVSEAILSFFSDQVTSKTMFLLFSLALFLFLGTFMDAIPAIVLFVPVILPSALQFGISSIHLGLIIVITMAIGQITPPYGLCLLLAGKLGDLSVGRSYKASIPYLSIVLFVLVLVAFFPALTLAIPKFLRPEWFV